MKLLKLFTILFIAFGFIFVYNIGMVNITDFYKPYPKGYTVPAPDNYDEKSAFENGLSQNTPNTQEYGFETRYNLRDENLDVYNMTFDDVIELSSLEDCYNYARLCIERNYYYCFFKTPKSLSPDTNVIMNSSDITKTVIYNISSYDDFNIIGYKFTYTYSHEILKCVNNGTEFALTEKQSAALAKAREFISTLENMDDYEKELSIHNYVCETITYTKDENEDNITDCYGGLALGRGNCQAYTDTFNLLCALAGFTSGRVTGKGSDTDHSWNYIKINNGYYFVDCTFDDGIEDNERGYGLFYFNVPSSVLSIDHSWENLTFTPAEELDYFNYYVHYGFYANSIGSLRQIYDSIVTGGSSTGEIMFNTSNGDADLTKIFTSSPHGYTKINVSKYSIGEFDVLKFKLT